MMSAWDGLASSRCSWPDCCWPHLRALARERQPRADAAWDDVLHLLGVLKKRQSLEAMRRSELTGQVAGLYVPQTGRLYVLGSGGTAPRSVIAHEVTHALQD